MVNDKRILITGTTSGIGLGILEHYHGLGWDITAVNRRKDPLLEERFPKVQFYPCDVRDLEGVKRYFRQAAEERQLPSVFFLSAGINRVDNLEGFSVDTFREAMDTNLMGVLHFVSTALPYLSSQKATFIAASSTSNIFPNPNCLGYFVSKLALHNMFQILDRRYRRSGLRFKSLILGPIATNIFVSGKLNSRLQSVVRDAITVRVDQAVVPIARFIHSKGQAFYYPKRACALFYTLRIVSSLLPGFYKGSAPSPENSRNA